MDFEQYRKQMFVNNQPVIIYNVGRTPEEYDGVIVGKSFDHYIDSYIVKLSESSRWRLGLDGLQYPWSCITMTEACLKRVGE